MGPSPLTLSQERDSQVGPSPFTSFLLPEQYGCQTCDLLYPQDSQAYTYTSSLVQSLTYVLPDSDVLKQFDQLRSIIKTRQRVSNSKKQHLTRLSKQIKTKLTQKFNELSIANREKKSYKRFYFTSGKETSTKINNYIRQCY